MTSTTDPSPSHARRKALREADGGRAVTTVISTFPIEKYYNATERLYDAFSVAMDERRLDDAYVLGIRFATFSIESLPKHCSYKQKQYTTLRLRNATRVEEVLQKIESVTERMDAEEKVKQRQRQEQLFVEEEKRKEREVEEKQLSMEKTKKERQEIEQSALAKLDAMMQTRHKQEKEQEEAKRKKADAARKNQKEAKKQAHKAEATLAQEGKRSVAEGAEKLAQQRREQAAHHNERESITSKTALRHHHKPPGLRTEEERTIELLNETIARQEERIKDIQEVKIPALLRKAKSKLAAGQRKEALYCVYRKRKWDHNVDVLKAGIFKMETQILHMESAVEDREVAKVMKAATDAMQTIQVDNLSGIDMDDMNHVMDELAKGVEHDMMFDEEELLRELMEESTSSSSRMNQEVSVLPGSQDLLSLPSAPSANMPDVKEPAASLMKPVVI